MRIGVIGAAAAVALIGGLLVATQVLAVTGTLTMGSETGAPGADVPVELRSNVGDPGLGAWTVDIDYDSSVVTVADCEPEEGGVCNPAFGPSTVRITGASATGLEGDTLLGTVTFTCGDAEGTSDLTLSVNVFADSTVGAPADIDETVTDGSVECAVPAPTSTAAAATATPIIVSTGTGGSSDGGSGSLGWIIAALAGAGVAGIAGYGALRMRTKRP